MTVGLIGALAGALVGLVVLPRRQAKAPAGEPALAEANTTQDHPTTN